MLDHKLYKNVYLEEISSVAQSITKSQTHLTELIYKDKDTIITN